MASMPLRRSYAPVATRIEDFAAFSEEGGPFLTGPFQERAATLATERSESRELGHDEPGRLAMAAGLASGQRPGCLGVMGGICTRGAVGKTPRVPNSPPDAF